MGSLLGSTCSVSPFPPKPCSWDLFRIDFGLVAPQVARGFPRSHLQELPGRLLALVLQLLDLLAQRGDLLREPADALLLPPHDLPVQLRQPAQQEPLLPLQELLQLPELGADPLPLRIHPLLQRDGREGNPGGD